MKQFKYVDDDLVLEIVRKQVIEFENSKRHYILEGFPKTRV